MPLPTEHPTLLPYLIVADAHAAIDFYVGAFGAREAFRLNDEDGRIGHAELDLGTGRIMLASAYPEMGAFPPAPEFNARRRMSGWSGVVGRFMLSPSRSGQEPGRPHGRPRCPDASRTSRCSARPPRPPQ